MVHLKDVSQVLAASLLKASSISAIYTSDQMEVPSKHSVPLGTFSHIGDNPRAIQSFLKALKKPILVMIFQNFKACLLEL